MNQFFNRKAKIIKVDQEISPEIQYYSRQIGIIKGIKQFNSHDLIYLIEFLDHCRIWATEKEIQILEQAIDQYI